MAVREEQPAVLHLEEVGFFIRVVRQFCSTRAMVDKFVAFANFLTEGLHDRTRHPDRAGRDLQDRGAGHFVPRYTARSSLSLATRRQSRRYLKERRWRTNTDYGAPSIVNSRLSDLELVICRSPNEIGQGIRKSNSIYFVPMISSRTA